MPDLVLYEEAGCLTEVEEDLLFERVASHYLRLQEERNGKKVRVDEALDACLAAHPESYQEAVARAAVHSAEFDDYLATRRKDHLLRSLVPNLYAAELGSKLGEMAAQRLIDKFENGEEIQAKDLLAMMKLGYELAGKVDAKVAEVTESNKITVNVNLKELLLGLPPETASDYMVEIGRRMIAGEK
jgi:hypothetical protein